MTSSNPLRLSRRARDIRAFRVMDLLARARALEAGGKDIIHMEVGEPDFSTPQAVTNAVLPQLEDGRLHYTDAPGMPELRSAIARLYQERHGLSLDASRIFVTPGASGALLLAMGAASDAGDSVLLTDPGYPCNPQIAQTLGLQVATCTTTANDGFQPSVEGLEATMASATSPVTSMLLASPMNPTGTVISTSRMKVLIDWAEQRAVTPIVDEIYHGLLFEEDCPSALEFSDDLFVVNSFSKYFGLTGWRVGWLVAPESTVTAVERLAQNLFLAAPTPGQMAALAALTPAVRPELEQRRLQFLERRDFLLDALQSLGFKIPAPPQGAFYIFADARALTDDVEAFVEALMLQAGVVVTPGSDFGDGETTGYIRFACTQPLPKLVEAVGRIRQFLESRSA